MDGQDVFSEETDSVTHDLKEHHAFSDHLKRSALVALWERPLERATRACVFCSSKDTGALSATRLRSHLARHLESLALRVLSGSNSEAHEQSASDGDSDAKSETPKSHCLKPTSTSTRGASR